MGEPTHERVRAHASLRVDVTAIHWMVRVAREANFPLAQSLDLGPSVPVVDAWQEVVEQCGVSEEAVATAVADFFRLPVADVAGGEITATKLIPGSIAHHYGVFPLHDEIAHLVVATANPPDVEAEKEVGFASGRLPKFQVAPPGILREAIEGAYSAENAAESLLQRMDADLSDVVELVEDAPVHDDVSPEEINLGGPVVRLTNMILQEAVEQGASDIHVQPLPAGGTVRYRVDGVLRTHLKLPLAVLVRVVSRIKIMARLDISDHLRPQDGRAQILVKGHKYDLRISTVPTRYAEKSVIRILDPFQSGNLSETGIIPEEVERVREMLRHRDGIFVVTGPTGSGKTTTMYAALREVATEDVNIMTVEDPVEYELPGLTQIQVQPKQGVTFASALRAILRQDPDVIFVGEIRDLETATIAAQASLTGHLVLGTVHANDAVGAVRRFLDLGLDTGTIGETLRGMLAQRLIRTVCATCAEPWGERTADDAKEEEYSRKFNVEPQVRAVGCAACSHTGYAGRLPVVEFVRATPELQALVNRGASHLDLFMQARRDGMRTMTESALDLVRAGKTTLTEVERVIGKENISASALTAPAASPTPSVREPSPQPTPPVAAAPAPPPAPIVEAPPPAPIVEAPPPPPAVQAPVAEAPPPPVEEADEEGPPAHLHQLDFDFEAPPAPSPEFPTGEIDEETDDDEVAGPIEVLIVDDDEDTRLFLRRIMERQGYAVTDAADGGKALLTLAKHGAFDLMLLDLSMPRLNGREVLQATRKSLRTASMPVVVLTGMDMPGLEVKLLEEGADDYLHKPINPLLLVSRIRATLRRAKG